MDKPPLSPGSSQRLPPSSHRLPTVSASQALQNLQAKGPRAIPTGLDRLDRLLANKNEYSDSQIHGLERGKVTEIWGPPGGGKTSLAMQTAMGALSSGSSVVWYEADTATQHMNSRFEDMLAASDLQASAKGEFNSYFAPTVAHVLALLLHAPPSSFPPKNTTLMVVDGLHAVFDVAYPRYRPNAYTNRNDPAKWAASRRYIVLGSIMAALKKLAALNDMAILVITGCATRVRTGSGMGAVLVPGLGSTEWENGVANRLVVLRDFAPVMERLAQRQHGKSAASARLIGLQKVNGRAFGENGEIGQLVAFKIEKGGLKEIESTSAVSDTTSLAIAVSSPAMGRKRRHHEIADSDADDAGSEYGSIDEDAEGLIDAAALNEEEEKLDGDYGVNMDWNHKWKFITQRRFPRLSQIHTELWLPDVSSPEYSPDLEWVRSQGCLVCRFAFMPDWEWSNIFQKETMRTILEIIKAKVSARSMSAEPMVTFRLPIVPDATRASKYGRDVMNIWKDSPEAINVTSEIPMEILAKLKYFLGVSNPLGLFMADPLKRRDVFRNAPTKDEAGYQPGTGFADAYPLSIMGLSSVHHVAKELPKGLTLDATRFRANIYISGVPPFTEDTWKEIQIGDLCIHVSCRTTRCQLPNVDQETGIAHRQEPFLTLKRTRAYVDEGAGNNPCLGMQMVPLLRKETDSEVIEVGQGVKVLKTGEHFYVRMFQ